MIRPSFFAICLALLSACGGSSPPPDRDEVTGRAMPATYPVFADAKPHAWDGRTPSHYPVHGIDVSRWQGEIDWEQVAASGVSFAFLKATEGGDLADPMFKANWEGARRAGVPRSGYHYYYFCRSAEEQARWFIRNVPRDSGALPHVLDLEWTPHSRTCPYRPRNGKILREARAFIAILERHYGKRPIVYTTVDFYRETRIGELEGVDFWLRSVAGHPSQVYPGADWTFWQYTGTGIVPGIRGPVDINAFGGSPQSWARWN